MDYDYDEETQLRFDEKDLFSASIALGTDVEEYDVEYDAFVKRFKRGEDWNEAIGAIRKILKKYHNHPDLPARRWLAEWRVIQSKLIPMIERHPQDRDMIYNIGKVIIFMTVPTTKATAPAIASLHWQYMRDLAAACTRSDMVIPAFLSLIEPALDAAVAEKSERDMNSVDLVLTLLKQMLEIENGNSGDIAGVLEQLIIRYQHEGVVETVVALSKLVERREFKRFAIVITDLLFQLLRGQEADSLVKAMGSQTTKVLPISGDQSVLAPSRAAEKAKTDRHSDALRTTLQAERRMKSATELARTRHSRFGTLTYVSSMGKRRVVTQLGKPATDLTTMASRRSHPKRKTHGGRQSETLAPPLQININDGIGTMAVDISGNSTALPPSELVVSAAQGIAARAVQAFLLPDESSIIDVDVDIVDVESTSALGCLTAAMKHKIARDVDDITPEDSLRYLHCTGIVLGLHRLLECQRIKAATAQVGQVVKGQAIPDVPLFASVTNHMSAADTSHPQGSSPGDGVAPSYVVRGVSAAPVSNMLDRWSFTRIVQLAEDFIGRKQWDALKVVVGHLKELILFIYALVDSGKNLHFVSSGSSTASGAEAEGFQLGETLVDQLLRDRDVLELLPKLLGLWDPSKFDVKYLSNLVEASHYAFKLTDAANKADESASKGQKRSAWEDEERKMELERFSSEFAHPDVISACITLLRDYNRNSVKINYYCAHLLKRLCALPNDFAGKDPRTSKPLTYIFMMYHVSVVQLASQILNDKSINGRKEFAEMRDWATMFSEHFLRDSAENPLLFVEALFWRSEKSSNADLARHYGLLDGSVAFVSTDGKYNAGLSHTGTAAPKLTKTAAEKHAAEAEARRNAAAGSESDEAELNFEDDDDALSGFQRHKKRNGRSRAIIKKKRIASRSSSSSSSDGSASSDSSSTSTASDSSSSKSSAPSEHQQRRASSPPKGPSAKLSGETGSDGSSQEDATKRAPRMRKLRKEAALKQDSDSDDSMSGAQVQTARHSLLQRNNRVMASDSEDEAPQVRPAAGSPAPACATTEELDKLGKQNAYQHAATTQYGSISSVVDDVDAELARDLDPGSLFA